jgi:hypothetical protein
VTCCHADRRDDDRYVMIGVTISHYLFFVYLLRWSCRYVGIEQCYKYNIVLTSR